jgi:hypothetical protein
MVMERDGVVDVQHHDADADARLADVALALATPFERRAIPRLTVWNLFIHRALFNPAAIPHRNRNESRKPQYRIQCIDSQERIRISEALGAGPRRHHDEVDDSRYGEEALS